jgi:hypothetical protein
MVIMCVIVCQSRGTGDLAWLMSAESVTPACRNLRES